MDVATGAIGSIISKVAELLQAEYKLQDGVKKRVESLTRELESAHAFLQEIDKVPPDQLNEQVKIWAYEVREASYDMEDVLDTFLVHVKNPNKPVKKNKLKRLKEKIGILFRKTKARHDIASSIDDVTKKLSEIAERRSRYKLEDRVTSPATLSSSIDPRIAMIYGTKSSMLIGIDEPKDAVINMLLSHDDMSEGKTSVVSLLGFGGVGKTTLAKAIYDQLKQKFQCGAFVSVGRNPDLVKVFKDVLFDLDKDRFEDIHSTQRGADFLIRELLEFLGDKRYLIVIDDVWETQSRKRITEALTQNNISSRIIITTRNSGVATGQVYKLQPLSDDNSKKLFYARIFGDEDKCPGNLRQKVSEVAHKILRKCGGVPLAIITMASLLVGKSMEEWFHVCNSIGFRDKDEEQLDDTMWILSLSYYDLPSHLKTCLLYLSVFPEDYLIKKDALIWMWIAEDFINGTQEIGLFEIGEGYFNDLVNRSLIQPVEDEERRIIDGCRIHDMILDLIRSLSRKTNFAMVLDNSEDTLSRSSACRIALQNRVVEDTPHNNHTYTARARSFFAFISHFCPRELRSFKLLRVLYLEDCSMPSGEHVGDLLHLRYLGIRNGSVSCLDLPKEIGAVKCLRVLYLEDSLIRGGSLPLSVGMLTKLVCLRVSWSRTRAHGGIIKNLTCLQELQIYPRDDEKGQFVKDLGNLRELRVLRTGISLMDRRMQSDLLKSLSNLDKLQCLELVSWYDISIDEELWDEGLLPRGLRHLFLHLVHFSRLPSCIDPSRLPNLSQLSLRVSYLGDQGLKILGGLPELCYLKLSTGKERATLTGTGTHGYFQKLRSCLLRDSLALFVVNEEDSSVSFTIWGGSDDDAPAFGSKGKLDNGEVARTVMPNLEVLYFEINVNKLTACNNGSCDNLGLDYLASLQKVRVDVYCVGADDDVLEKEEAALRHAIQVHPNLPTLEIQVYN